jgi:hypothetical protein
VAALDQISWVVVAYAVLVALLAGWSAYRWRARPPWLGSMSWMLATLVALRAVAGLGVILSGRKPDEVSTQVGYLLASVCIMPLALRSVQDDDGAWSLGVVGVAAATVAVVSVRVVMTL